MKHTIATTTGITLALSAILLLTPWAQGSEMPNGKPSKDEIILTKTDGTEIVGRVYLLTESKVVFAKPTESRYSIPTDQLSTAAIPEIHKNWLYYGKKVP